MQSLPELNDIAVEAIFDKKGQKVLMIDLTDVDSAPAPYLIICQARSSAQVAAVADSVKEKVNEILKIKPLATEGYRNSQWIIVDYGHLMIHVFQPEIREYYRLEELWGDGKFTEFPNID